MPSTPMRLSLLTVIPAKAGMMPSTPMRLSLLTVIPAKAGIHTALAEHECASRCLRRSRPASGDSSNPVNRTGSDARSPGATMRRPWKSRGCENPT